MFLLSFFICKSDCLTRHEPHRTSLGRLQLIQNSAARLLTKTKKREHITPVLAALHWLPVTFRIDFKVLLLTYKALNGRGPNYILNSLTHYVPKRTLRSSAAGLLEAPGGRQTIGDAAFVNRAPKWWNALPKIIREAESVDTFKRELKTYLFTRAFLEWHTRITNCALAAHLIMVLAHLTFFLLCYRYSISLRSNCYCISYCCFITVFNFFFSSFFSFLPFFFLL